MFGKGNAILALCAAAAFGCESTDPGKLSGPATGPHLKSAASEFVTTGGAEITIIVDDFTERYSFVANREQDGVVGQLQGHLKFFGDNIPVHADVTCFTIVGNKARVGGIITNSDPQFEGLLIIWTVEDNGEGNNAPAPDRASQIVAGNPAFHCAVGDPFTSNVLFPLETGNVQIHSKES